MVCNRCILVVKQELQKMYIDNRNIYLGEVETRTELTQLQIDELASKLATLGLNLSTIINSN